MIKDLMAKKRGMADNAERDVLSILVRASEDTVSE